MAEGKQFPKDFFWGAATSAHQVEGGNLNDWSEWEKENAERLSHESGGKYPPENYISGKACDHYNRYEEDFDIAKQLGHNAHRFSIEWSRVEPEEGKFDEKEIEHYWNVIRALRERGMEPFVTLWHWTVPSWFQKKGGWLESNASQTFGRFVERMAKEFGSDVQFWCTLNEPVVFVSYGYLAGIRPPQQKSAWQTVRVFHRLASAHRRAYRILHRIARERQTACFVGIAKHNKYFVFADARMINSLLTALVRFLWNDAFLLHIWGYHDFVGLNYYNKNVIDFGWNKPRKGLYNLEISAEGFFTALMDLARWQKPIYVLENGLDDLKDAYRAKFIRDHLVALEKARQQGADVRGYFHWSLLDNFEWENGFWPRFGLVEVDYSASGGKTLERHVRPSAWEYKKIIEEGL